MVDCPDCGERVGEDNAKCPYCNHGKYINGDI